MTSRPPTRPPFNIMHLGPSREHWRAGQWKSWEIPKARRLEEAYALEVGARAAWWDDSDTGRLSSNLHEAHPMVAVLGPHVGLWPYVREVIRDRCDCYLPAQPELNLGATA